jgi:hypothetical protein
MDDATLFFLIVGGLVSLISVICFFALCKNVSKIHEQQKLIIELLRKISVKQTDNQPKEKDEFNFLN